MPFRPLRELKPELFADEQDMMNALTFDEHDPVEDETDDPDRDDDETDESNEESSNSEEEPEEPERNDGVVLNVNDLVLEPIEMQRFNPAFLHSDSQANEKLPPNHVGRHVGRHVVLTCADVHVEHVGPGEAVGEDAQTVGEEWSTWV